MNNPIRRALQKHVEFPALRESLARSGVDLWGARILEVGCGSGYGCELIQEAFQPRVLVGVDLMPEQIAKAKRRGLAVEFTVADAARLPFRGGEFDAVFALGVLHHIVDWPAAVRETARVLRPGGLFLFQDLGPGPLCLFARSGLVHPEVSFSYQVLARRLRERIESAGFALLDERGVCRFLGHWYRSFLCQERS